MEGQEQLIETLDDSRLGEVDVIDGPTPHARSFIKRTQHASEEEYLAAVETTKERKLLNNDVLLTVHEIRGYPEDFITEVIYEFPQGDDYDEKLGITERLIGFRCILEAIAFLQENKRVHGDIRPSFVYFSKKECWAKLIDRLADRTSPLQCQLGNIKRRKFLYMPPKIFEQLVSQSPSIKHNAYKTDVFALGMTVLETFCLPSLLQSLYNIEEKKFNYAGLEMILDKLLHLAVEDPTRAFVVYLKEVVLQPDESKVLGPKESLALLKEIKELKPIWEIAFYSDVDAKNIQQNIISKLKEETDEKNVKGSANNVKFYNPIDFVDQLHQESHKKEVKELLMLNGDKDRDFDKNVVKVNSNMKIGANSQALLLICPDNQRISFKGQDLSSDKQESSQVNKQNQEPQSPNIIEPSDFFKSEEDIKTKSFDLVMNKSLEIKDYLKSLGITPEDDVKEEEQLQYLIKNNEKLKICQDDLFLSHHPDSHTDSQKNQNAQTNKKFSDFVKKKAYEKNEDGHIDQSITDEIEKFSIHNKDTLQGKDAPMINILEDFIDVTEPNLSSSKNNKGASESLKKQKRNLAMESTVKFQKQSIHANKAHDETSNSIKSGKNTTISNEFKMLAQKKDQTEDSSKAKIDQNTLSGKKVVIIDIDENKKKEVTESRVSNRKIHNDLLQSTQFSKDFIYAALLPKIDPTNSPLSTPPDKPKLNLRKEETELLNFTTPKLEATKTELTSMNSIKSYAKPNENQRIASPGKTQTPSVTQEQRSKTPGMTTSLTKNNFSLQSDSKSSLPIQQAPSIPFQIPQTKIEFTSSIPKTEVKPNTNRPSVVFENYKFQNKTGSISQTQPFSTQVLTTNIPSVVSSLPTVTTPSSLPNIPSLQPMVRATNTYTYTLPHPMPQNSVLIPPSNSIIGSPIPLSSYPQTVPTVKPYYQQHQVVGPQYQTYGQFQGSNSIPKEIMQGTIITKPTHEYRSAHGNVPIQPSQVLNVGQFGITRQTGK